jgi:hypothetical protein
MTRLPEVAIRHTPQVRCCGSVLPVALIAIALALVTIPRIACAADITISQLQVATENG